MKHIQKNDFINNIEKIKKEIESTIFRFNLEVWDQVIVR